MRIIIAFLSFVGFLLPCQVNAQTSYADVDDFWDHVSPGTYDPADSLLYGAPSTSDAYSAWQWNMRQILEGESYDSLFVDAPRTVKVAVIGMFPGCDDHPDLDDICLPGKNYIEGTTDTSPTWDGKTATRSNRHDQCVVSIIAAEHNSIGVAGVAAMARVIPIRTDFDHLAEAINWAISQGAEVIHIPSLVGTDDQRFAMWPALFDPDNARYRPLYESASKAATLSQKIYELRQTINEASFNGVIISTVVNNWSGEISIKMEGAMGETISTQAVNALGEPSPFISTAYFTDMLAPGGDRREFTTSLSYPSDFVIETKYADADDVLCAISSDKYSYLSGGSAAGPHVAAAAAIIKSYLPDAKTSDVRRLLTKSMQPFGKDNRHLMRGIGGMLSLKRLKAAIDAE